MLNFPLFCLHLSHRAAAGPLKLPLIFLLYVSSFESWKCLDPSGRAHTSKTQYLVNGKTRGAFIVFCHRFSPFVGPLESKSTHGAAVRIDYITQNSIFDRRVWKYEPSSAYGISCLGSHFLLFPEWQYDKLRRVESWKNEISLLKKKRISCLRAENGKAVPTTKNCSRVQEKQGVVTS